MPEPLSEEKMELRGCHTGYIWRRRATPDHASLLGEHNDGVALAAREAPDVGLDGGFFISLAVTALLCHTKVRYPKR